MFLLGLLAQVIHLSFRLHKEIMEALVQQFHHLPRGLVAVVVALDRTVGTVRLLQPLQQ